MKKIMKKLSVLLSLMLCFVFTACGGGDKESKVSSKEEFKPVTLRYATQHSIDHAAQASAEAIKAEVEEKTNGRIKITIYPANQLGDWTQVYDEVMMGSIDIAHTSVPETYDARIGAGFLPYLARNYDELAQVMAGDSYLVQEMKKLQKKFNIHFFGYYCEGFSGIGTSKPVLAADQVKVDKGVVVRVPGNDAFKLPTEYLGYRTSTIPYADTFAAIQTGVVDGWQAGPPNLNYLNFRDVITHYYHYNLTHEATQMYMSEKVWEKLLPEDQKILEEAIMKQSRKSIEIAKMEDEKYMDLLRKHGITVVTFDDATLATMAEGVRNEVWEKLSETYTKEFLDGLLDSYKEK